TKWGAYYDNENIKQYDEVIKELCHVQKIIYIPTFKILSSSDLLDGIHPNTDGHKKMFEKIRNNIETILN
ncbi:MAG: hypothetical protein HYT27_02115, partial [Parcubacteria group bacterium]|nr:hypothetical protein [Parcubacteria group bacterium]